MKQPSNKYFRSHSFKLPRWLEQTVAIPSSHTHYPDNSNHRSDVSNIAIIIAVKLNYQTKIFPSSSSSLIILTLLHQVFQASPQKPSHINWEKYEEMIKATNSSPSLISSPHDLESIIAIFTETISSTLSSCTSQNNSNQNLPLHSPWDLLKTTRDVPLTMI